MIKCLVINNWDIWQPTLWMWEELDQASEVFIDHWIEQGKPAWPERKWGYIVEEDDAF